VKSTFSTGVLTADDRLFVRARIALCAALLVLAPLLVLFDVRFPNGRSEILMYLFLLGLMSLVTAIQWIDLRRHGHLNPSGLMLALVPDVVSVAGLTYLFAAYGDAFYPVVVLMPVGYALVVSRRHALVASVASAAAYVIGQALVVPVTAVDLLLLLLKAAAVPLITVLVSVSVGKRDRRGQATAQVAAENQEMNERLRRDISELQAVGRISDIIHSSLELEDTSADVLDVLAEVVGIESCSLLVIDKENSETLFSASLGEIASTHLPEIETGIPSTTDTPFSCISIYENARAVVLFCAGAEDIERLDDNDKIVLSAVASELVVGVENSHLYRLTRHMSITDELTGLYNYRYLQQRLDEEIGRARRYNSHLSLLMIDADDFKGFNDAYGHVAGDLALGQLAEVLKASVREIDIVARYGGEEFSIALPQTDSSGAFVVAEKVREAVRTHSFVDAKGEPCSGLTVSIGLATFPSHANDKDSLLRESDDALYRAKNGGKNRVRTPRRPGSHEDAAGEGQDLALATPNHAVTDPERADEWTGD